MIESDIPGVLPKNLGTGQPQIHIPSVWDALELEERHKILFFRPGMQSITEFCVEKSRNSPVSKVGSHKCLWTNLPNGCTPAHRCGKREKTYLPLDESAEACGMKVLVFSNGVWKRYDLARNHPTVIPPGCPHALMTGPFPANIIIAGVWIFFTSKDTDDIFWEPDAERLLKNEHMTAQ